MINGDLDCTLIDKLQIPACYPDKPHSVQLLETHISWVLLAGDWVYKIKKPVDFGFLDFSDLAKRHYCCEEELRLNRRLAPELYLEVVAIGGSVDRPILDLEPAIEYAVKMRRFAENDLLDHMLKQGRLQVSHLESLAATLAAFHAGLPSAATDAGYGDTAAVIAPARQNFQQLSRLLSPEYAERLDALKAANETEFLRCQSFFSQRLAEGWVKEGHGDLHLGNIVLLNGRPTPFDGIEFNPALRWIDTVNDIAFLVMDIQHRGRDDLAYAFLNAYLQYNGDYAGLAVLHFYLAYRAMVMAKVSAIRAAQTGTDDLMQQCEGYLTLAEHYYKLPKPALIITHGLPGSGKTTLSQLLVENYRCIRIRSDVERKRLFGLQPLQTSSPENGGIYTKEAGRRTYRHLLALAETILQSGFSVVVDAAFLKRWERQMFRDLALNLNVPFAILSIRSADELQRQRIRRRQLECSDASEADVAVYDLLKSAAEALTADEQHAAVEVDNSGGIGQLAMDASLWKRLDGLVRST